MKKKQQLKTQVIHLINNKQRKGNLKERNKQDEN